MKEILENHSDCNMFSLSRYYGDENIADEEAERIIVKTKTNAKEKCLELYKKTANDNPQSFDEIIEKIREEIEQFDVLEYSKQNTLPFFFKEGIEKDPYNWKHFIFGAYVEKKHDNKSGIYDVLIEENKRISQIVYRQKTLRNRKNYVEEDEMYFELKPYLKKTEITFQTHCTIGPLFETYYFELNDVTKKMVIKT